MFSTPQKMSTIQVLLKTGEVMEIRSLDSEATLNRRILEANLSRVHFIRYNEEVNGQSRPNTMQTRFIFRILGDYDSETVSS